MTRLLFITTKINERDDDFAFTSLWVKEFIRQGFNVQVICMEKGLHTAGFPIFSLGKEAGLPMWRSFLRFQRLILMLRYDRVFVHMNPKWVVAGAWLWWWRRTPAYLWYTHYKMLPSVWIAHWLCRKLFCATKDSMPFYDGDPKKVVTGHGVDMDFWNPPPTSDRESPTHLLAVHRISRSKRLDVTLRALALLSKEYTLTHYGRPLDPRFDPTYEQEIKALANSPELRGRVKFMGSVPMPELKKIYPRFQVMITMVPDTIDKTVLEGMACGVTPVITKEHAEAIGFPSYPPESTPEAVADYIKKMTVMSRDELRRIAAGHNLSSLVRKIMLYVS